MSLPPTSSNGNPVGPQDEAFQNRYIPTSTPREDDEEFKGYMNRDTTGKVTRPYKPKENELITPDRKGKDNTYLSFGDNGTTASITELGQLMQFSRYLGAGSSSIFVADNNTWEPYMMSYRSDDLQRMARNGSGFGKDIIPDDDNWTNQTFFLRDRWPRLVFSGDSWELVSQWMVKHGVVIQQSMIENLTDQPLKFKRTFDFQVLIRDLDFVNPSYPFNEEIDGSPYTEGAGPNGYGFVKVHRFTKPNGPSDEHKPKTWYKEEEEPQAKEELESETKSKSEKELGGDVLSVEGAQNLEGQHAAETIAAVGEQHDAEKKTAVVVVDEKLSLEQKQDPLQPEAVGLVIGFFVDGKAKKREDFCEEKWHTIPPRGFLELVAGYKLVLLTSKMSEWKPLVLSAADVDIDRFLSEESSSYVIDDSLDYSTRRNLEHILSVCAIPVPQGHVWDYDNTSVLDRLEVAEPVALTCGDMSGHRVCISASFFAFKFLAAIARHLRQHKGYNVDDPENPFKRLRDRIQRTCEAHLRWVFKTAKMQDHSFAGNYWVNGNIMPRSDKLVSNDLTNTPYQVLKAFEYYQEFSREDKQSPVKDWLGGGAKDSVMDWIRTLNKENTRDWYTWRHPQTTDFDKFRLDDHVWIWNALKAISTILDWEDKNKHARKKSDEDPPEDSTPEGLTQKYDPSQVQREMIRRFTTKNDSLNQRMLAVTRSDCESRFDFHSRDTALFYDLPGEEPKSGEKSKPREKSKPGEELEREEKLKPGEKPTPAKMLSNNLQEWKNTLDCQKYLEENQYKQGDNPLRYALSMVVASQGFSINTMKKDDVFTRARSALMRSMLSNGLFPGLIDEITQKEKSFEDEDHRDFYLHVGFELPYVLWIFKTQEGYPTTKEPQSSTWPPMQSQRSLWLPMQLQPPGHLSLNVQVDPSSSHPADVDNNGKDIAAAQHIDIQLLSGRIPFNKFFDSHNVVEILDEWLYTSPPFLDFKPSQDMLKFDDVPAWLGKDIGVVKDAIKIYKDRTEHKDRTKHEDRTKQKYAPCLPKSKGNSACGHLIVDVGKNASCGSTIPVGNCSLKHLGGKLQHLCEELTKLRTAKEAAKRFIWLPVATKDCALMCFLTAHEAESVPISLFFEHHAKSEQYFFDEAELAYNKWETEFHMSFLQLSKKSEALSKKSEAPFENQLVDAKPENLPILDSRQLVRASAGYRFIGDFFDRFWTCIFIENYPCKTEIESPLVQPIAREDSKRDFWQQRKVLELMLSNRIINEMNRSMKQIVDAIKKKLADKSGHLSFAHLNIDQYLNKSPEWEDYIQILDAMGADFAAMMDKIKDWENREKDRQQGQPLWTRTQEGKYRSAIANLLVLNRKGLRELREYQATVQSLRTSLVSTQERIRNELGLRQNNNIRYFTYATVVFLPLGFASSLLALQTAPTGPVAGTIAKYDFIAVIITIFLLTIAQSVWKFMKDLVTPIKDAAVKVGSSILPSKNEGENKSGKEVQESGSNKGSKCRSRRSSDSLV